MNDEILNKIRRGDGLTGTELLFAMDWFNELQAKLEKLGPHFHLAWHSTYMTYLSLRDMARFREIIK